MQLGFFQKGALSEKLFTLGTGQRRFSAAKMSSQRSPTPVDCENALCFGERANRLSVSNFFQITQQTKQKGQN